VVKNKVAPPFRGRFTPSMGPASRWWVSWWTSAASSGIMEEQRMVQF
jgi:hypothetical protein